ncbi:hypothetical protein ACEQPO_21580 [Bacillus sp. SL00103]
MLASYVVNPQKSYEDVASVAKEYGLNIALSDEKYAEKEQSRRFHLKMN